MSDEILLSMASELRQVLLDHGLDPASPPTGSSPPAGRAFREYCAREGDTYDDPDEFAAALVREVSREAAS